MKPDAINLKAKLSQFTEQWSPRIVAQMNDYQFKLTKLQGDFVWHRHTDTDEVFIVIDGEMRIDFRDGPVALKAGEMIVIPKTVEHKPFSEKECHIMLVEPAGTVNTGDAGGDRTQTSEMWV